jgi:hypothetical protein
MTSLPSDLMTKKILEFGISDLGFADSKAQG